MPNHTPVSWKKLKIGIVFSLTLLFVSLAIVNSGFIGVFILSKQPLFIKIPDVGGLRPGSPVWIQGIEVGTVQKTVLHSEGVIIKLAITRPALTLLRKNAQASIQTTGLLEGDQFISLTRGTADYPRVKKGDTITGATPPGLDQIIQASLSSAQSVQTFVARLDSLVLSIQSGQGLLGELLRDSVIFANIRYISGVAADAAKQYKNGDGTIKELIENRRLSENLSSAISEINDIGTKIDRGQGAAARMINDPALYADVDSAARRIGSLADSLAIAEKELNGRFSQNLSQTIIVLKNLLEDIKKNPKKYVTVKIF